MPRPRAPALLVLIAIIVTGCSTAPSLTGAAGDIETTGSIGSPRSLVTALGEADALPATVALDKALDPRSAGNPVNWTSSGSGRSGDFASAGDAYLSDDRLCRGFVASIAEQGTRTWMRGAACRTGGGPWSLQAMLPFDGKI